MYMYVCVMVLSDQLLLLLMTEVSMEKRDGFQQSLQCSLMATLLMLDAQ